MAIQMQDLKTRYAYLRASIRTSLPFCTLMANKRRRSTRDSTFHFLIPFPNFAVTETTNALTVAESVTLLDSLTI